MNRSGFISLRSLSLSFVCILFSWVGAAKENPVPQDPPEQGGGKAPLDPAKQNTRTKSRVKYRMAQLALKEGDLPLAERFFKEALTLTPENGALRFEYAQFMAEQGKGKRALELLRSFVGSEDLLARAEYLKTKIKIAAQLNGRYVEKAKAALKHNKKDVTKMRPDGLLTVDTGEVRWVQKINSRDVTQTYRFPVNGLLSNQKKYELKLKYVELEAEKISYIPDRNNVVLTCEKDDKRGWVLKLEYEDDKKNKGLVVFESEKQTKAPPNGN